MSAACPVCLDHDPPPPVAPRVSVAVLHYEQHADLARTLGCLQRQTLAPVQVIVSDDGSAVAPDVPDDVLLLRQPDRGFRAALARNRALAAATGDVVAFLDADTSPEPGYLEALAGAVRREPDVLAVGRRRYTTFPDSVVASDDPLAGAVDRRLDEPTWLADGWASIAEPGAGDEGSFRFVIGATLAGSTDRLRRLGGFDESFAAYGGEDWDLGHRWWLHGGGLRYVADAVAWHHGPHAGEEPRTWDDRLRATDRALGETLGIAARVHTAPVAFRGLRGAAPPRVVLTHDDALGDRELVVTVDAALAALPLLGVLTDRPALLDLGDPRVTADPAVLTSGAVRVDVHRGVMGDAWPDLLDALAHGDADTLRWLDADGDPLVSTSDLRRVRRSHLGLATAVEETAPLPEGLTPVGEASLAAWLGGWAR